MRMFLPCLLGGLLLWLSAGCLRRETTVQSGTRERILYRSLSGDPSEVDPHVISTLPEINVASALFEGLVDEDPVDLHPVPGVAQSWNVDSSGRVYTFHLRADARWSNGESVTAGDFIQSFQRILTRSLGADYATMLYVLSNAEAYHKGSLADFSKVGATAPDPQTLRLTLEHPVPYFLSLLTHPAWYPVPLKTIEKAGPPYERGNRWTRPATIVGNGAFVLRQWQPGRLLLVERSSTYWDAASVRLKAIRFLPATDVDSEERAFRAGQVHVTEALPFARVDAYRRESSPSLRVSPFLDTYFYRLNVTRPPLDKPNVRRALSLAIDRSALVSRILRGGQQPAHSFVPPGCPGYTPPDAVAHDPDAARRLLAEAGHPGGRGLPPVEILINSSGNHLVIAEAVQEMWHRELGVDARIVNMEQGSLLATRRALNYQVLRSDWAADYLDATTFLDVFASDSSNNHTGWKSSSYDSLLSQADRTHNRARRSELLSRAESLLLAEAPIIPIYYYTTVRLVQPSVKGWNPTLLDRHPYKHVWLAE